MQGYWARFAADTDPSTADETAWPAWSPPDPEHLVLDLPLPCTTGSSYRAETCDFWDTVTLTR
jgi:carboxylesterase type B